MKRGEISVDVKRRIIIESDDYANFRCDDRINNRQHDMSETELKKWATLLNSPWSQNDIKYTIEVNCNNAYEEMDEGQPEWRCIYFVYGYDGIYTSCIGYGNTVEEALKDCKNLLEYLQDTYNKKSVYY